LGVCQRGMAWRNETKRQLLEGEGGRHVNYRVSVNSKKFCVYFFFFFFLLEVPYVTDVLGEMPGLFLFTLSNNII
jgi:hypothetical protein